MNKTPSTPEFPVDKSIRFKNAGAKVLGHLPVVRDDGGNTTGHGPGRWVRKRVQRRRERERDDE